MSRTMESRPSLFAVDARRGSLPTIDDFEELVEFVVTRRRVMVRYSKGPEHDQQSGPSRDYEADVALPGLSVTTIEPEPWWPRPAADWIARRVCKYAELGEDSERYPWLLTARVVGQGPDHEPLVVEVIPLARVSPTALAQALEQYHRRFDVGRGSR
jgi:hypothetical protein